VETAERAPLAALRVETVAALPVLCVTLTPDT